MNIFIAPREGETKFVAEDMALALMQHVGAYVTNDGKIRIPDAGHVTTNIPELTVADQRVVARIQEDRINVTLSYGEWAAIPSDPVDAVAEREAKRKYDMWGNRYDGMIELARALYQDDPLRLAAVLSLVEHRAVCATNPA